MIQFLLTIKHLIFGLSHGSESCAHLRAAVFRQQGAGGHHHSLQVDPDILKNCNSIFIANATIVFVIIDLIVTVFIIAIHRRYGYCHHRHHRNNYHLYCHLNLHADHHHLHHQGNHRHRHHCHYLQ